MKIFNRKFVLEGTIRRLWKELDYKDDTQHGRFVEQYTGKPGQD